MSFSSGFTKFDGLLDRKNLPIFQFLNPITEPTQDVKGRIIQIWHYQKNYLGAVLDVDGSLTIVPEAHIHNGLQPNEVGIFFLNQIASSIPKKWGLVALSNRHLVVWPHLVAAGRPDSDLPPAKIDGNIGHIFRESEGHLLDTPENRQLLISVASDYRNWIGTDEFGNEVYLKYQPDGSQVWIHRRGDRIGNGGANLLGKHSVFINDQKTRKGALQRYFELSARTNSFVQHCLGRGSEKPVQPPGGGGGNGGPGLRQFQQLLQQTGLVRSYNSAHPYNPMPEKGGLSGEIGGVACSVSYLKGLFDGPETLFEEDHLFSFPALPDGKPPFTEQELSQVLRELAIGIYVHSAVPFFSLHFRQEGTDLFPVIHPIYEHTLVGRVIGMLDYIMKGYLNGGVYQEKFIDEWYRNPDWKLRSDSALQELINFHEYCLEHMQGKGKAYIPLAGATAAATKEFNSLEKRFERTLQQVTHDLGLAQVGRADGSEDLFSFKGFRNSFRIIAKQNKIQKEGNLFEIDGDFSVFYDVRPSPLYAQALEVYTRQHGVPPHSHTKLLGLYEEARKNIHDHMAKMPLCRGYFAMLSVIHFFTSYFSTLKQYRKMPSLPLLMTPLPQGVPPVFPHLPTVIVESHDLKINIRENVSHSIRDQRQLWILYLTHLFDHLLSGNKEPYVFSEQEKLETGLEKTLRQDLLLSINTHARRAFESHPNWLLLQEHSRSLHKTHTVARL